MKRKLLFGVFVILVSSLPYNEGIIPTFKSANAHLTFIYFAGIIAAVVIYLAVKNKKASSVILNILVAGISILIITTLADIILRPILAIDYESKRPHQIIPHKLPEMPLVSRYNKDILYEGEFCGNMTNSIGKKEYCDKRDITFITDSYGFRNANKSTDPKVEVLALGDSYGVGSGSSQESTWSALLESEHDFDTYNLSTPGASPWEEYINLIIEQERLNLGASTTIVWMIFSGNDLNDEYGPTLLMSELPWNTRWGVFWERVQSYRNSSPIRGFYNNIVYSKSAEGRIIEKDFINEKKILFNKRHIKWADYSLDEIVQIPRYSDFSEVFKAMVDFTKKESNNLLVVFAPSKEEIYRWVLDDTEPWTNSKMQSGFSRAVKNLSIEHNVEFLDLTQSFLEESKILYEESGGILWWYDDTHWNVEGNTLAAQLIRDKLVLLESD